MRRFLHHTCGVLLAVVFVLTTSASQPTSTAPFPSNSIEAKEAVRASLKAIGFTFNDALDNRDTLQSLMTELGKRHGSVPTEEEIKRLLMLLRPATAQLQLMDPDRTPLLLTAFARQNLRGSNPDLLRAQEQTWPPELSNGEKVSLQVYTDNLAYKPMNDELRAKGAVSPRFALVHDRLQSAFRKAQPFNPPIRVSRGINLTNKPQLDAFLTPFTAAQKDGTPYVMKGYVSTSVGDKVLFAGNVHMHIKVTHGLDLYPISLYPNEKEVLLNHNSSFRVKGVRMDGKIHVIELDQIPPGGK